MAATGGAGEHPFDTAVIEGGGDFELALEVVLEDPVLPEEVGGVDPVGELGEERGVGGTAADGRGVEGGPAVVGDPGFDPAMGVGGGDDVPAADGIKGAALEAGDDAGGDAEGAEHDGEGGGEVFAVAFLAVEEEVGDGVRLGGGGEFEGVFEIGLEPHFEAAGDGGFCGKGE